MEMLHAKMPFMVSMEEECFQMSASKLNLRARQEEIATVSLEVIVTVNLVVIATVNHAVIATVNHVVVIATAAATVEVWREEEEEDHLPEISALGAATRVIGKNFITNYKWMEKDEIEWIFKLVSRYYGGLSMTGFNYL